MKLFCIIQGPLISYGQGPNNVKKGFQTSKSILENICTLKKYNIDYLYVTWHPKNINEINELKFLTEKNINYTLLKSPNVIDPDHRFKHHYSIKSALDFIKIENYDYLMKIRSDQVFTSECINSLIMRNTDKLIVSELMNNNSFYVGDFIYFAKTKVFIEFIYSQLTKRYFLHPVIANDIGFKYYLAKTKKSYITTLFIYFFLHKKSFKNWELFIYNNIETIKSKDWENILWRDKKISSIISSSPFYFTDSKKLNHKILNLKIYIRGLFTYIRKVYA